MNLNFIKLNLLMPWKMCQINDSIISLYPVIPCTIIILLAINPELLTERL